MDSLSVEHRDGEIGRGPADLQCLQATDVDLQFQRAEVERVVGVPPATSGTTTSRLTEGRIMLPWRPVSALPALTVS